MRRWIGEGITCRVFPFFFLAVNTCLAGYPHSWVYRVFWAGFLSAVIILMIPRHYGNDIFLLLMSKLRMHFEISIAQARVSIFV